MRGRQRLTHLFDRLVAANRRADQAEIEALRAELVRLRSDVEAELALIRAERSAGER